LSDENFFPNFGSKLKVLVSNQKGLENLYNLITISHIKTFFRKPSIFREDLLKHREGLIFGASGGRDGEIFNAFSSFVSEEDVEKKMKFYDYIELYSLDNYRNL
jgi:DNA polymerase-3 subunit alpha (Gram-positive type)